MGDDDGECRYGTLVAVAGVSFGVLEVGTYVYSTILVWEISSRPL